MRVYTFFGKEREKHPSVILRRRISNVSERFFLASLRQNDHAGQDARGFVDIFMGKPVYKVIGDTGSSSRDSVKVRVGFAGSAVTEKPIPLSNGAAANILLREHEEQSAAEQFGGESRHHSLKLVHASTITAHGHSVGADTICPPCAAYTRDPSAQPQDDIGAVFVSLFVWASAQTLAGGWYPPLRD